MPEKERYIRMRYVTTEDGSKRTEDPLVCGKMVCHGFVSDGKWWILNLVKDRIVMRGESKDEEQAKRDLKKGLKSLGAYFNEEVRASKNNPTPMLTDKVIRDIIKEHESE